MSVDFSHAQTTNLPDCEVVYSFGESLEVYKFSVWNEVLYAAKC